MGTGFPFVASYDSQAYGGGILTRLHTGENLVTLLAYNIPALIAQKTLLIVASSRFCRNMLVCEAVIQYRMSYICLFRGRSLAPAVYVTI
jgi:hypothetical protein